MATKAADRVFLDTNILVYASSIRAPFHQSALTAVQKAHETNTELWISRQVLREYLAALSRPQPFAASGALDVLVSDVRYFSTHFSVAEDCAEVTEALLDLAVRFDIRGKQIHDANIVATMVVYNIPTLLTANVGDFTRYESLINIKALEL